MVTDAHLTSHRTLDITRNNNDGAWAEPPNWSTVTLFPLLTTLLVNCDPKDYIMGGYRIIREPLPPLPTLSQLFITRIQLDLVGIVVEKEMGDTDFAVAHRFDSLTFPFVEDAWFRFDWSPVNTKILVPLAGLVPNVNRLVLCLTLSNSRMEAMFAYKIVVSPTEDVGDCRTSISI